MLSADGSELLAATLLGGSGWDGLMGVRVDEAGDVYVAGHTQSADFPVTEGAPQRRHGGESDCFITRLSPNLGRLVYSTLLGGSANDFFLMPTPDPEGRLFVVGETASRDFPVTENALRRSFGGGNSDGVLAVLSPDGARLLYATYLGGSGKDMIRSVALGPNGEVYMVGSTSSGDFPATPGCLQREPGGGGDAFIARLTAVHAG